MWIQTMQQTFSDIAPRICEHVFCLAYARARESPQVLVQIHILNRLYLGLFQIERIHDDVRVNAGHIRTVLERVLLAQLLQPGKQHSKIPTSVLRQLSIHCPLGNQQPPPCMYHLLLLKRVRTTTYAAPMSTPLPHSTSDGIHIHLTRFILHENILSKSRGGPSPPGPRDPDGGTTYIKMIL